MYDSAFAAFYYPWIKVENPERPTGPGDVHPAFGPYRRRLGEVDETRGVWKAPANETIAGCLDVECPITKNEQSLLNPIGVNCIRPFGTRGIRIWGAEPSRPIPTGATSTSGRLFNMVETTILDGTQWAVFEPNDVKLWEGV